VLQCVAVCCSALQCVAVCCSVLQCVAVCCSVLQCFAVCCSVLGNAYIERRESRAHILKSKHIKDVSAEILRSPAQKTFGIVNSTLETFFFYQCVRV